MKITVLGGAGMMGRGIVRDLLSTRAIVPIEEVRVPDSSPERLDSLMREFRSDTRLRVSAVDVSDETSLRQSLTGASICINAVPTLVGLQLQIFQAALDARVHYTDLGGLGTYTVKQLQWNDKFADAGVCAVIGVGADPGMSNVICRAVADELDHIDRINLYWAAEVVGCENPILVPPYSVSTVLAEYANPSTQFLNGQHVTCEPMTGQEAIKLDDPWGICDFMYSPHSEQLTVPLAKGIREKGIQEFTWKLHLPRREHEAWIGLVKAGFGDFDDEVLVDGLRVRPLDVLSKVIFRNIERNYEKIPTQESHEIHFAIGRGTKSGKATTVKCEVIVRPNSLYDSYKDAATSMNASIAAQLLLAGPRTPGVFAPEEYFPVAPYFRELEKREFEVRTHISID